jgi:hypothetical protein
VRRCNGTPWRSKGLGSTSEADVGHSKKCFLIPGSRVGACALCPSERRSHQRARVISPQTATHLRCTKQLKEPRPEVWPWTRACLLCLGAGTPCPVHLQRLPSFQD